jgi:hypothetical protein
MLPTIRSLRIRRRFIAGTALERVVYLFNVMVVKERAEAFGMNLDLCCFQIGYLRCFQIGYFRCISDWLHPLSLRLAATVLTVHGPRHSQT